MFHAKVYLWRTIFFTALMSVFFGISPKDAFGLDIQNLDYQMNNQIVNNISEHTITFDSVSPIAIGNSLSITFPNEFTFNTTPVQSDVEVRVNGVLLGSSEWSFSKSLNTLFIAFQTTAAPGSDVEVTLTQDVDLMNPAAHDNYDINLGVNSSFVATAEVWIFPESNITVSAAVLGEPVVVGGGSGGGGSCYNCFFNDTQPFFDEQGIIISFKGFSAPRGTVQLSIDDYFVGTTSVDNAGVFLISVDNVSSGFHTFEFVGLDQNGVETSPYILTLSVGDRGFVYANDVFLSPTITVEPRGDYGLVLYGYTVPYAELDLNIDGYLIGTVVANGNGLYFFETLLDQFEIGEHTLESFLKGTIKNLSSGEKTFIIDPVFNSDQKQLQFIGDPLFDVLLNQPQQEETFSLTDTIPYAISFIFGAFILWGGIRIRYHVKNRDPYISDYED